jgi:ATP-binding cassette, subfamily D (ALD), peroxisomal long-chain fatty acid import protein
VVHTAESSPTQRKLREFLCVSWIEARTEAYALLSFYNGAGMELSILEKAYMRLIRHVNSILKIRVTYSMCEDMILKYGWSAAGYVIIAAPFLFGEKAEKSEGQLKAEKEMSKKAIASDVAKQTESYISNRRLLLSLADAGSRLMYSYKELAELAGYTSRVYTLISTLHSMISAM